MLLLFDPLENITRNGHGKDIADGVSATEGGAGRQDFIWGLFFQKNTRAAVGTHGSAVGFLAHLRHHRRCRALYNKAR
jgi:hypothetical protein